MNPFTTVILSLTYVLQPVGGANTTGRRLSAVSNQPQKKWGRNGKKQEEEEDELGTTMTSTKRLGKVNVQHYLIYITLKGFEQVLKALCV